MRVLEPFEIKYGVRERENEREVEDGQLGSFLRRGFIGFTRFTEGPVKKDQLGTTSLSP